MVLVIYFETELPLDLFNIFRIIKTIMEWTVDGCISLSTIFLSSLRQKETQYEFHNEQTYSISIEEPQWKENNYFNFYESNYMFLQLFI